MIPSQFWDPEPVRPRPRKWWSSFWSSSCGVFWFADFTGFIQPLGIQSPLQMMIGVYNHLLRKVFRFHYHSQKVIGSLGNPTLMTIDGWSTKPPHRPKASEGLWSGFMKTHGFPLFLGRLLNHPLSSGRGMLGRGQVDHRHKYLGSREFGVCIFLWLWKSTGDGHVRKNRTETTWNAKCPIFVRQLYP